MYYVKHVMVGWIVVNLASGLAHSSWRSRRAAEDAATDLNRAMAKLELKLQ